jgi:hypothetical protein
MADPRACHAFYLRLMSRDIPSLRTIQLWFNSACQPSTAF